VENCLENTWHQEERDGNSESEEGADRYKLYETPHGNESVVHLIEESVHDLLLLVADLIVALILGDEADTVDDSKQYKAHRKSSRSAQVVYDDEN